MLCNERWIHPDIFLEKKTHLSLMILKCGCGGTTNHVPLVMRVVNSLGIACFHSWHCSALDTHVGSSADGNGYVHIEKKKLIWFEYYHFFTSDLGVIWHYRSWSLGSRTCCEWLRWRWNMYWWRLRWGVYYGLRGRRKINGLIG